MRVAYLAESSADQAAIKILTETILEEETESVFHAGLRHRGWPTVRTVLPSVLKEIHYRTDAVGLVVVVDSNGSRPHLLSHDSAKPDEQACRLCQLRQISDETLGQVRAVEGRPALKVAVGLAVPTIEAWLLCGQNPHVTEAAWSNALKQEKRGGMPYSKSGLKRELYGVSHPSLGLETDCMKVAAERVSKELALLNQLFPGGFGAFRKSLSAW